MTRTKGLLSWVARAALAPELRPAEIRIVRALAAAALAYLGVKYAGQTV